MSHFNKLIDAFKVEWATTHRTETIHNDGTKYWWVEDASGLDIINWECRPFPGCASLVVTTKVVLREDHRGQGLGRFFRELRHKAYARAGFQGEIATVRTDNAPQNHLMQTMGATKMGEFPSDFGGSYALWLTKLTRPNAAPAPRPVQPARLDPEGPVWMPPPPPVMHIPYHNAPAAPKQKKFSHRKPNG